MHDNESAVRDQRVKVEGQGRTFQGPERPHIDGNGRSNHRAKKLLAKLNPAFPKCGLVGMRMPPQFTLWRYRHIAPRFARCARWVSSRRLKADMTPEQAAHLLFEAFAVAALPSPGVRVEANGADKFIEATAQNKAAAFRPHCFGDRPKQKQPGDGSIRITDGLVFVAIPSGLNDKGAIAGAPEPSWGAVAGVAVREGCKEQAGGR